MKPWNENNYTGRSDLLVKHTSGYYNTRTYRLTGENYGKSVLSAIFRPSGWRKDYQIKVIFNSNSSYMRYPLITVLAQQINDNMSVVSERCLLNCTVKVNTFRCPFCNQPISYSGSMWKCAQPTCGFMYSPDTCVTLHEMHLERKLKGRGINCPEALSQLRVAQETISVENYDYEK